MQVRSLIPHFDKTETLHPRGDVYSLEGEELALRLKDGIVVDAAVPDPAPDASATPAIDAALEAPPSDPLE